MAQRACADFGVSIRVACETFSISESCFYYQAKLSSENMEVADWLLHRSMF
jgi:putative transposase